MLDKSIHKLKLRKLCDLLIIGKWSNILITLRISAFCLKSVDLVENNKQYFIKD